MDFPISVPSVGLVDGRFVDEDPLLGRPGSLIPSAWGNSITLEVLNVIEAAGLDPSEADLTQLLQAIRLIAQSDSGTFGNDTGAANVYTVAYSPAIPALANGLTLRFKAKTANTSASTFSPNGLVAKPLVGLGAAALQGGEIVANGLCTVVYSATSDQWMLVESTGGALQVGPATKSQHALQLGQASGRLLRTTIYINNAGILQASVDGAAFANVGATFTPQSLTRLVHVIGVGAGGAGAGSASTSAGSFSSGGRGGSAGGISEGIYSEGFSGVPVAVGLGGVGVNGATGGNGGSTSFGALLSVPGGPGGAIVLNTPIGAGLYTPPNAASAVPTGGKIYNGAGNPGGQFTSFGQDTFISGAGASTIFGAGGEAKNSSQAPANSGVNGSNGLGYGSGGSGAGSKSSNPSLFKGGDGVGGLLIVKEYS